MKWNSLFSPSHVLMAVDFGPCDDNSFPSPSLLLLLSYFPPHFSFNEQWVREHSIGGRKSPSPLLLVGLQRDKWEGRRVVVAGRVQ
jgi:hypothetical protein